MSKYYNAIEFITVILNLNHITIIYVRHFLQKALKNAIYIVDFYMPNKSMFWQDFGVQLFSFPNKDISSARKFKNIYRIPKT